MDSLQFQKAEFEEARPKCLGCRNPLEGSYFQLAGRNICANCADAVRNRQGRPQGPAVMRGFLYGLAASVACAVGYAIVTWATGATLALISIAVGYVVGRAVRIGSGGLGGRRCQILAVALTYFAITISYAPAILSGMRDFAKKDAAKVKDGSAPAPKPIRPVSRPVAIVVTTVVIGGMCLAMPFLEIAAGFSGLIGVIIVLVGLAQAWKQTARDPRLLMGPYPLTGGSAVG